jgi:hypothetical protein
MKFVSPTRTDVVFAGQSSEHSRKDPSCEFIRRLNTIRPVLWGEKRDFGERKYIIKKGRRRKGLGMEHMQWGMLNVVQMCTQPDLTTLSGASSKIPHLIFTSRD